MNNEFELIFDKNEWKVMCIMPSFPNIQVSVRFLINPSEDEKMFWNASLYQRMLRWLKKEHQELLI